MGHGGHEAIELVAAFVLVIGGGILTVATLLTRPARSRASASASLGEELGRAGAELPSLTRSVAFILAGLSAGAAIIHLVAAPSHYLELGDLGAGFLFAGVFQAVWVRWCLAGPSRRTALVGIAANVAILLAWVYTRTVGLPVGPFAGGPEPIGFPDGASVAFELALVAGLIPVVLRRDLGSVRRPLVRELASIAVVPIVGLVIVLTSLATVAIASGLDHGASGHAESGHVAAP